MTWVQRAVREAKNRESFQAEMTVKTDESSNRQKTARSQNADETDETALFTGSVGFVSEIAQTPSHRFVLWRGVLNRERACCIACGRPPVMHGDGALDAALVVEDPNEVALIEAAGIVVAAAAMATNASAPPSSDDELDEPPEPPLAIDGDERSTRGMMCRGCLRIDVVRLSNSLCSTCAKGASSR